MKILTVRLSDEDCQAINTNKGKLTVSDYIRQLISEDSKGNEAELSEFKNLLKSIKGSLAAIENQKNCNKEDSVLTELETIKIITLTILQSMPAALAALKRNHPEMIR